MKTQKALAITKNGLREVTWYKTDLFTIRIVREDHGMNGGIYVVPEIQWANQTERGPKTRSQEVAKTWAGRRVCTRLGDAAIAMVDKEGEEILTW